jgi:hypothetical protein
VPQSALLVVLAMGAAHECTLEVDEDGFCEKVYWISRAAALAVPSYVFSTDGHGVHHGLSWTLAVEIPWDAWRDDFAIGVERRSGSAHPQLGVAGTFVWLPGALIEGRLLLRAHVISFTDVYLWVAAGGAYGTDGPTPRMELRLRVGHTAWGGGVLVAGFEPNIAKNHYTGDVSVGLEAPWVWWW